MKYLNIISQFIEISATSRIKGDRARKDNSVTMEYFHCLHFIFTALVIGNNFVSPDYIVEELPVMRQYHGFPIMSQIGAEVTHKGTQENGALFLRIGTVANGLAYGHITTTVNLTEVDDQLIAYRRICENLQAYLDYLEGSGNNGNYSTTERAILKRNARRWSPNPTEAPYLKPIQEIEQDIEMLKQLNDQEKLVHRGNLNRIRADERAQIKGLINWIQLQIKETETELEAVTTSFNAVRHFDMAVEKAIGPTRQERAAGLIIAGGAAVLGLVSGLFGGFSTASLAKIVKEQDAVLASQIESNIMDIARVNKDVETLNKTLSVAVGKISELIFRHHKMSTQHVALYHAWGITENLRIIRKTARAVIKAQQGHFSSDLVPAGDLIKAIDQVRSRAVQNGKEIGIRTVSDIFSLPTSYLYDITTRQVTIICHIPLSDINANLDLYEYISAPIVWQNDKTNSTPFVEITSPENYIAISKDGTMYRTFTEKSLNACLRIAQSFYCDDLATFKIRRPSCLSGLLNNRLDMIKDHCTISSRAEATRVVRVNESTYALISGFSDTLHIRCEGSYDTSESFRGTTFLKLEPGCIANTKEIKIERAKYEPPIHIKGMVTSDPIKLVNLIPDQSEDELEELFQLRKDLGQIGQPVPVSRLKNLQQFQRRFQAVSLGNLLGSTVPISTMLIIAISSMVLCFCCLKRNQRFMEFFKFQKKIRYCCNAHRIEDHAGRRPVGMIACDEDAPEYSFHTPMSNLNSTYADFKPDWTSTPNVSYEASVGRGLKRTRSIMKRRASLTDMPPNADRSPYDDLLRANSLYSVPNQQLQQNLNNPDVNGNQSQTTV